MILPIKFLWKQLNGPQVMAFVTGIYNHLKAQLDPYLEYFNNLSLRNANSKHLNLMGTLMGIPRAFMEAGSSEFFWFSLNSTQDPEHGFSETGGTVGGRFTEIVHDDGRKQYIPDAYYRTILQAAANSEGEPGSLVFMDDIISALRANNPNSWEFTFEDAPTTNRSSGDVNILLSQRVYWLSPMIIEAVIQSLGDTLYAPEPRVFVDFVS